jgi:hypothetical protein
MAEVAEARRATYAPLLADLGLAPAQVERTLQRLQDIHKHAITTGDGKLELMKAKLAYDNNMRSALGEDGYARYRAHEDAKPFRREVAALQSFAQQSQQEIPSEYEARLIGIFQKMNFQTMESWDGPYDPLTQSSDRQGDASPRPRGVDSEMSREPGSVFWPGTRPIAGIRYQQYNSLFSEAYR